MQEPDSKELREMRMLSRSLEAEIVDPNLLRSFLNTLETSPTIFLPHAIAGVFWTAFLMYKADLMQDAKLVAFSVLAWMLRNSDDADLIQSCISNVQYLFKKEGRDISPEEVRQIASEDKYRQREPQYISEAIT